VSPAGQDLRYLDGSNADSGGVPEGTEASNDAVQAWALARRVGLSSTRQAMIDLTETVVISADRVISCL
jgi:hypothetical protein